MITSQELRGILRLRVDEAGGAANWCRSSGISETHVSLILSGHQKPGPKMAKALGFRKAVHFVPLQTEKEGA